MLLAAILLMVVVLGFFLPPVSIILMTAPIILPPLKAAGFDLIWFGVVMTIVMEMGLIHPPVGLNIFVIKNIAPDIPLQRHHLGRHAVRRADDRRDRGVLHVSVDRNVVSRPGHGLTGRTRRTRRWLRIAAGLLGALCLGGAAAAPAAAAGTADEAGDRTPTPLERLWQEPDGIGIVPFRQSDVMVTHTSLPNDAPYSPNPADRVTTATPLNHTEIKFDFSLKAPVVPSRVLGHDNSLWVAYSQQSHWQAFAASRSRPFRESDYAPELIFSHRLAEAGSTAPGMRPLFVNMGMLHQSNGQSDPLSRSWNRAYVQWGLEQRWSADESVALLLRPWWRLPEAAAADNNPDIAHYLGYGDIECDYWNGDRLTSLLARVRSLQLDFSTPLLFLSGTRSRKRALQLHLQLFTGYGESLIDYNQRHTTLGVGFSVPYGL